MSPPVRALCEKWGSSLPKAALLKAIDARYSAARGKTATVPVDVFSLAKHVGAVVTVGDIACDGLLSTVDRGGYLIQISSRSSEERRRFTCAHELGHVLFIEAEGLETARRTRSVLDGRDHSSDREEETLCNFAAAELLMPFVAYGADLHRAGIRSVTVPQLASQYQVSLRAAARRSVELGNRRHVIFLFEKAVQGWRLKWIEAPQGAVSETIEIAPTSRLAHALASGSDFCGRYTLFLGPVADEYLVDAAHIGRGSNVLLILTVFLGGRRPGEC